MFERRARSFEDMGREHVRVWCLGIVLCAAGIVAFVLAAATLLQQSILLFSAAFAVFIVVVTVLAVLYPAIQGIFITAFYTCAKTVVVPSAQGQNRIKEALVPGQERLAGRSNHFFVRRSI